MDIDDDLRLVNSCRAGDRRASQRLVELYQRPVFNAAFRILGNTEDAADVAQTTFLKVFEHLDDYDAKHKLFSWIYRIAVNASINQLHSSRRWLDIEDDYEAEVDGPEEFTAAELLGRKVQECLMELLPDLRIVLVLRHFSDCSYEQIADVLQLPEKTVKSRIYSARQRMKEILTERGVTWI